MSQIGATWIPFFKGGDPDVNEANAVEAINTMVAESHVRVISVETVYQPKWHGLSKVAVGLRVWHESK